MTKLKFIAFAFVSTLFLQSCSKVLEPVTFFGGKKVSDAQSAQEDFDINIKSLTFESARDANKAPYPRRLMQTGAGSKANVFNEADFLTSNIPPSSKSKDYLLGIGDQLRYTQLNEFMTSPAQFPTQLTEEDYLLGVGDELTLIQLNEAASGFASITGIDINNQNSAAPLSSEIILKTSGLVGTNGNILLLGLGSIEAEGRSLSDLQTEVRNIIIRKGLAPSFQLEITGFNSKKAFISSQSISSQSSSVNHAGNVVSITNLPVTLKELAINYGVQPSSDATTIVSLTRGDQKFRMTAGQLFDKASPSILIQDRDQIEIDQAAPSATSINAVVGSKRNILLPGIGSLKAEDRSLAQVQAHISRILIEEGLAPSFQLEVAEYRSRKFSLVTENSGIKVVSLTDTETDLKEAILSNIGGNKGSTAFTLVELTRGDASYRMSWQEMLSGGASNVLIQDGDTIKLKDFNYKLGQVFALGGAGNAGLVPIDPSKRETLADILFSTKGAFNNLLAKRSEVYLLRGRNPSVAYHLDAQNVSRILVAAQTELRPNDIVYVADRPIISFSRTLAEISPLRILLRDLEDGNIP